MTDKEYVLSVYENAFCSCEVDRYQSKTKVREYPCYRIHRGKNGNVIGISFFTEDLAWTNAKDRLNFKFINMLKEQE
jgi:hypothetical protein